MAIHTIGSQYGNYTVNDNDAGNISITGPNSFTANTIYTLRPATTSLPASYTEQAAAMTNAVLIVNGNIADRTATTANANMASLVASLADLAASLASIKVRAETPSAGIFVNDVIDETERALLALALRDNNQLVPLAREKANPTPY
jgi:hypothetical protein